MPDPSKLLPMIRKATDYCRRQPGRQGWLIELTGLDDVLITGDLHGHLENFRKAYQLANLAAHPRRHLIVQELIHPVNPSESRLDLSHRLVDLVAAAMCQFPGRVHYLMGNHELAQMTNRDIAKNDMTSLNQLYLAGVMDSYGDFLEEMMMAYHAYWDALPFAIRLPNRVMLTHSMPAGKYLKRWTLESIMKPIRDLEEMTLGGAFHSLVWGRDVSESCAKEYMEIVDADYFISGHIPCDEGYMMPNSRQMILDTKDDQGAVILIPVNRVVGFAELPKHLIQLKEINVNTMERK